MGVVHTLVGYGICSTCGWSGSETEDNVDRVAAILKEKHDQESDHCFVCRIYHQIHVTIMKRGSNTEVARGRVVRSLRSGRNVFINPKSPPPLSQILS